MALDSPIHLAESMGYFCKEFFSLGGINGGMGNGFDLQEQRGVVKQLGNNNDGIGQHYLNGNWDHYSSSSSLIPNVNEWDHPNSSPEASRVFLERSSTTTNVEEPVPQAAGGKRKRRRTRACKNKEELENQRMTHIAVERNRRKQMNDYLAIIRSLMPPSYVQRGDQASIIGGAINFVKELEQHLQSLEAQKGTNSSSQEAENEGVLPPIFADFFTFPQYSRTARSSSPLSSSAQQSNNSPPASGASNGLPPDAVAATAASKKWSAMADIEVSTAESHANLKILCKKRPRQLFNLVSGLQCMWFTILHLNVTTTLDQRVLYSISVKLEEGCQLTTVDEIADAVNHLLGRIEEEAA